MNTCVKALHSDTEAGPVVGTEGRRLGGADVPPVCYYQEYALMRCDELGTNPCASFQENTE